MTTLDLKPTQKPIKAYYESLDEFKKHGFDKETIVRDAFADLLKFCARKFGTEGKWTLIPEYSWQLANGNTGAIDGAIVTDMGIVVGYWEAKDTGDDLKKEVQKKFKAGYPQSNILFQSPEQAMLYRDGGMIGEYDLTKPEALVKCLQDFFGGRAEVEIQWEEAVQSFKERIHDFGNDLEKLIEKERKENPNFAEAFRGFAELCRQSINPNLSDKAVEEMLIQHLLTRRIFETVLTNRDFMLRNPIGNEIEKVVAALTGRNFNPQDFFKPLEHYYTQLEAKARTITEWSEKQQFLNTIYEKFFQGFSVKVADTHGIVYTPQPIVDFMVRSVQHILKTEFNRSLGSEGVHILDPFVGTGSFMMRIIREIGATQKSKLPQKYKNELHANEVMLLPYYIASMNIEHEYFQQTKQYHPFDGICLVDTFELREGQGQLRTINDENTRRIQRQQDSPIFVVIGNPPYNAWQQNENDNNKNRRYLNGIDKDVNETYTKESRARNKNALGDPYVKAFRFAQNRIHQKGGIIAFVSNNSYLTDIAFDGMRNNIQSHFDEIFIFDLGGNVRKNPKLSGTTHNVFGIQVGVCITLLVRRSGASENRKTVIHYTKTGEFDRKGEKLKALENAKDLSGIDWKILTPDIRHNWITDGLSSDFENFLSIAPRVENELSIFKVHGRGIATCRDAWLYNFDKKVLERNVEKTIQFYSDQIGRYKKIEGEKVDLDRFVENDDSKISWSEGLKLQLKRSKDVTFDSTRIINALYRPFTNRYLYYDKSLIERTYQFTKMVPALPHIKLENVENNTQNENYIISLTAPGNPQPFQALMTDLVADLHLTGDSQCFPFYTYDETGGNAGAPLVRKENITDWALEQFKSCVSGSAASRPGKRGSSASAHTSDLAAHTHEIGKWDIFYYVYGLLHHPGYRTKYAANLRRELPRIPLPKDAAQFWALSEAGKMLADLHVNYETVQEYPLEEIWDDEGLDLRVEKMKLTKDKSAIVYNQHLTLRGIPSEAFEYRLGNRSAIDWIIDQYQISKDKRSLIVNDPNRADDPSYIVSLLKRVTTVSVETVKIVQGIAATTLD